MSMRVLRIRSDRNTGEVRAVVITSSPSELRRNTARDLTYVLFTEDSLASAGDLLLPRLNPKERGLQYLRNVSIPGLVLSRHFQNPTSSLGQRNSACCEIQIPPRHQPPNPAKPRAAYCLHRRRCPPAARDDTSSFPSRSIRVHPHNARAETQIKNKDGECRQVNSEAQHFQNEEQERELPMHLPHRRMMEAEWLDSELPPED
ncbi:hypothetical protein C8R45DRAFT_943520 [Mycena sanguinolenta]|nr:hypothetical protein C8R45DRAFT_943520 [Mycena sanguinolenta]